MMTIPNMLTCFRILLIPIFVVCFYLPFPWAHPAAAVLFAIAGLTDWLDGYLARNLHQGSRFGTFLDPLADKLAVAVALVLVVGEFAIWYLTIPAAIIVAREILISGLREWMAEIGKHANVKVLWIAKFKTAAQMIALILLLYYQHAHSPVFLKIIGLVLLYIATLLTLWSMLLYVKAAWSDLTFSTNKQ